MVTTVSTYPHHCIHTTIHTVTRKQDGAQRQGGDHALVTLPGSKPKGAGLQDPRPCSPSVPMTGHPSVIPLCFQRPSRQRGAHVPSPGTQGCL